MGLNKFWGFIGLAGFHRAHWAASGFGEIPSALHGSVELCGHAERSEHICMGDPDELCVVVIPSGVIRE